MSNAEFDPYLEWLEIPPQRRPPTYYDLLGLAAFECDPERIQQAALKRIELVRRYKVGRREEAASELERELTQAWNCLHDTARKSEYDAALRGAGTLHAAAQQTASEAGQRRDLVEAVLVGPAAEKVTAAAPGAQDLIVAELVSPPPSAQQAGVEGKLPAPGVVARVVAQTGGQSPFVPAGTSSFAEAGRSARARSGPARLRASLARFGAHVRRLSPRAWTVGVLTICLSITAVVLVATGRGGRVESTAPFEPLGPVPGTTEGWQRGLATVELVDSSGEPLGHTTRAIAP